MNVNNLIGVLVLILNLLTHVRISCHVRGIIIRDLVHYYTYDIKMDSPDHPPTESLQEILTKLSGTIGRLEANMESNNRKLTAIEANQATTTQQLKQQIEATQATTTQQLTQQIKSNGEELGEKITQINNKLQNLEIRIDDKIRKESEDIKIELKDHIKHEIQLSEGAQNVEMKQKIDQSVQQVEDKVTAVDNKIKVVDNKVQGVQDQYKQLAERMEMQEDRVIPSTSTGRTVPHIPRSIEDKIPTFSEDKHSSPYGFLTELDSYLKINHVQPRLHINVISHMMLGRCRDWFKAYQDRFMNVEEFKRLFILKYCNEDKQFALRDKLLKTKYHPKSGCTMTQHCLMQIVDNKNLKEPFSEEHLVRIILRHYDVRSQQIIYARNVKTFMELEKVLEQIDQINNTDQNKTEQTKTDTKVKENTSTFKGAVNTDTTPKEGNLTNKGAIGSQATVPNQRFTPYSRSNKPYSKEKKHVSVITESKESKND